MSSSGWASCGQARVACLRRPRRRVRSPLPSRQTRLHVSSRRSIARFFRTATKRRTISNPFESCRVRCASIFAIRTRRADDVDAATLDATETILRESVWIWSGETFGIAEVARGAGTREKVPGWITVKWRAATSDDRCGRSTVGVAGGYIEFNLSPSCRCGRPSGVYPRLIRHELGHAMGYYHTDSLADAMYGQAIPPNACDALPSDRERRHAKFAYGASR